MTLVCAVSLCDIIALSHVFRYRYVRTLDKISNVIYDITDMSDGDYTMRQL